MGLVSKFLELFGKPPFSGKVPLKVLKHGEYIAFAVTIHISEIIDELLKRKDYYLFTAADTDFPIEWIKQKYSELNIKHRMGEKACLIYPCYGKLALENTLVGGDAFYICEKEITDFCLLDAENYGCLADYSIWPNDKQLPIDVVEKAIEEMKQFNAIYHVSHGFSGVLFVVTSDHSFNNIINCYFGDFSSK